MTNSPISHPVRITEEVLKKFLEHYKSYPQNSLLKDSVVISDFMTTIQGEKQEIKPLSEITDEHLIGLANTQGLAMAKIERETGKIYMRDDTYELVLCFDGRVFFYKNTYPYSFDSLGLWQYIQFCGYNVNVPASVQLPTEEEINAAALTNFPYSSAVRPVRPGGYEKYDENEANRTRFIETCKWVINFKKNG